MSKQTLDKRVSRRVALQACLAPAGIAAAHWLVGCSDEDRSLDDLLDPSLGSEDAGSAQKPGLGADGGGTQGSSAQQDAAAGASDGDGGARPSDAGTTQLSDAAAGADGSVNVPWASSGTGSMQGNYPDPFSAGGLGAQCVLYPAQTLGPCYAQMPPTREDISDGMTGLPLRLSFLVVGADGCTPIPNASVDLWHSGFDGVYSAFRPGTICNPGTENAANDRYCRGVQTTDAEGKVNFSTIFPGWYTGRSIHIHFTVRLNARAAVTSQLYFDDALCDEILAQGEYAARGPRDTTNQGDFLFRSGGATAAQVTFSTAKRPDGVLHAWKVLSIRDA